MVYWQRCTPAATANGSATGTGIRYDYFGVIYVTAETFCPTYRASNLQAYFSETPLAHALHAKLPLPHPRLRCGSVHPVVLDPAASPPSLPACICRGDGGAGRPPSHDLGLQPSQGPRPLRAPRPPYRDALCPPRRAGGMEGVTSERENRVFSAKSIPKPLINP